MKWEPRFAAPKSGDVVIASMTKNGPVDANDGLIHDWAAATFVRGVNVEQVLAVLQNYGAYKKIYAPEVSESRLIEYNANRGRAFLRIVKKKAITVVLNAEFEIEYRPLEGGRWAELSRSTRIVEVEDGKELPVGSGHGFLWKLNAYWLLAPQADGVYVECRTLSLSRDIPQGLGWILKPLVSSLPKESLQNTLMATARAAR